MVIEGITFKPTPLTMKLSFTPSPFGEKEFGTKKFAPLHITWMRILSVVTHPPSLIAVRLYFVVVIGVAMGVRQFVQLKLLGGVQFNETILVVTVELIWYELPTFIVAFGTRVITGLLKTVISTDFV